MKTIGVVLIVIGIVMMIFRSVSFTQQKKVVDLGPVQVDKKENKTVDWPLYAGAIVTVAGVVILIAGNKNKV